jgi:hypothetical protein
MVIDQLKENFMAFLLPDAVYVNSATPSPPQFISIKKLEFVSVVLKLAGGVGSVDDACP